MRLLIIGIICLINQAFAQKNEVELVVQSGHSGPITDVQISPDNQFVASSGEDNRIVIWDRKLNKQFGVLLGHTDDVMALAFGKEPHELYSVSLDGTLRKWDIISGECNSIDTFSKELGAIAYIEGSQQLLIGGAFIHVKDLKTNQTKHISSQLSGEFYNASLIESIAMSEDHTTVIFSDGKKRVGHLNLKEETGISVSRKAVSDIHFLGQSNWVVCSRYTGGLAKHEVNTMKTNLRLEASWKDGILSSTVINDRIYIGTGKGLVKKFDTESFKKLETIEAHDEGIISLNASKDKSLIVSATKDGEIKVWDAKNMGLMNQFQAKVTRVNDITFSEDGTELIILYHTSEIRRFNLANFNSKRSGIAPILKKETSNTKLSGGRIAEISPNIVADAFRLKKSTEYHWVYGSIKEYGITWNDEISFQQKSSSTRADEYFKYVVSYINFKTPLFLDKRNLIDSSDKWQMHIKADTNFLVVHEKGQTHKIFLNHDDIVTAACINDSVKIAATSSWDGLIKLWDLETDSLLLTIGAFDGEDFSMITPNNYYFSTKTATENLGFRYRNKLYSFDQFDLFFNRPDKVLARLKPIVSDDHVSTYYNAFKKRLDILNIRENDLKLSDQVPELSLTKSDQNNGKLPIRITAKSGKDFNRLHLIVNGVPEFGVKGLSMNGSQIDTTINLQLSPGQNKIQAYAVDVEGMASLRAEVFENSTSNTQNQELYLITLGGSEYQDSAYNLKYAHKDARDITTFFKQQSAYSTVHSMTFENEDLTTEKLKNLSSFLEGVSINDVVVIFAAGHGVLGKDGAFYLASHNMNFEVPELEGIPYSYFDELLGNCKSRYKCMFIDACHSGEIDISEIEFAQTQVVEDGEILFRNSGNGVVKKRQHSVFDMSKAIFTDMRPNNGATVISSAGGAEFALEGNEWNNSVFTYCILDALKNAKADFNGDGQIMLSELHKYVSQKVPQLTKGRQQPTSRIENIYNDFQIHQ